MSRKKTAVIGASPNPARYSFIATNMLSDYDHPVLPLGRREGKIGKHDIVTDWPDDDSVHTVTMYMGARHQPEFYDYILGLKPKRIIFNPGAENVDLEKLASDKGIETVNACTLVMLRTGQF